MTKSRPPKKPKRRQPIDPNEGLGKRLGNPASNMHIAYTDPLPEFTAPLSPATRKAMGLDPFPTMTKGHSDVKAMLDADEYETPVAA